MERLQPTSSQTTGSKTLTSLWTAFSHKPQGTPAFATKSQTTRDGLQNNTFGRMLCAICPVRTVYAAEAVLEQAEPAGDTTLQRLGQNRPAILVSDAEVREYVEGESGEDRLRELFSTYGEGQYHPDLENQLLSIKTCSVSVFMITSVFGARAAKDTFVKKHQVSKFETKFQAARKYNDALFIGGAKAGVKWGLRTAAFSGLFLISAQSIATYRNKSSVMEYVAAGTVTCSLLRANLGLRGMFAGGLIGSVLGLIGGGAIYVLLLTSNETQEEKHYWRTQEMLRRKKELALQQDQRTERDPLASLPS